MAKRIIIAISVMIVLMLIIYGIFGLRVFFAIRKFSGIKPQTYVSDQVAKLETWQPFLTAVGNLTPVEGVAVSNQMAGTVIGIQFHSGTDVKRGELLVQLDDTSERAQRVGFKAQVQLAQMNLKREQELVRRRLDSQANLDAAENTFKQAQSNLMNDQASIGKLTIRAPFSGRIGIRAVNLGQYLPVGSTIANLQSLDTLYAQFTLPEQDLATLAKGEKTEVTVAAYPGKKFSGDITAIDSDVDPNTHNITVQAALSNPSRELRAGMFANVRVDAGKPQRVVTVAKAAVDYSLYGTSVFIIRQDGKDAKGKPILKVTQLFVTTGEERGDRVAITKGLKPGDLVVTAGQQKLQTGMQVEINNSVTVD